MTDATVRRRVWRLLLLLFTVSGACGLVYEIVWMRRLAFVFGSTTLAVSTVLAAFMGGLAFGSLWFGRYADRNPECALSLYGRLEIAIGALAALVPLLLGGAAFVYLRLEPVLEGTPFLFFAAQFLLAAAVLMLPTALMGGTLPLLARFAVLSAGEIGGRVGALYAANTLGAAGGVALATYVLLPHLGLNAAERLTAAANVGVGVAALWLRRSRPAIDGATPSPAPRRTDPGRAPLPRAAQALLWGTALSGFSAMVYEVAWSRTLAMVLGSSVYAFGMMLLVFLAGLSLGSALFARSRASPSGVFAAAQTGIAAAGLAGVFLTGQLPAAFLALFPLARSSFLGLELVQLAVTAVLVLPAATLFGMAFPAVIAATTASLEAVGVGIGRATLWNTAGTVSGAFLGGFVLVPHLGLRAAMLGATAASAGAALATAVGSPMPRRRLIALAAGALAAMALVAPAWPRAALASGVGFFAGNFATTEDWRASARRMELLFYRDGVSTTLSVDRENGQRIYRSNGKTDASTAPSDMAVQVLIGQLGLLLHPDPKDVFVLGLGTGVSAAAVARHPVRSIDIVDIEPAGVDAARFFEPENRRVLSDPRVRYLAADGRNALLARPKSYDVVISDPSDIWVAGVGNLFTREFYTIARSRLNAGGVMVQWWHTHALDPAHLKLIVATFRSVFPHASYWRPNMGDVILVGSVDAVDWDLLRLRRKFEMVPGLAEDLRSIGIWSPIALFGAFALADQDLDRLLEGTSSLHTDDRPVIEFYAPRFLYADTTPGNDHLIEGAQTRLFPDVDNFDPERDLDAHETYLLGFARASMNRFDSAIRLMEESVRRDPTDPKTWIGLGNQYRGQAQPEKAAAAYRSALAVRPGEPEASVELAALLRAQSDTPAAEKLLRAALRDAPGDPSASAALAEICLDTGRAREASMELERSLTANPSNGSLHLLRARAMMKTGRREEARASYLRAMSLLASDPAALLSVGEGLLEAGAPEDAARSFQMAVSVDPGSVEALIGLARAHRDRGDLAAYREASDRARRLDPNNPALASLAAR
ncbi:MAG TPA: fused MFS/spermidine synthase [Thermoanaerobaculia bacterium]|nr:fused MFS/spermidine synthase [Thermoanaerobaculia bacterium]